MRDVKQKETNEQTKQKSSQTQTTNRMVVPGGAGVGDDEDSEGGQTHDDKRRLNFG